MSLGWSGVTRFQKGKKVTNTLVSNYRIRSSVQPYPVSEQFCYFSRPNDGHRFAIEALVCWNGVSCNCSLFMWLALVIDVDVGYLDERWRCKLLVKPPLCVRTALRGRRTA